MYSSLKYFLYVLINNIQQYTHTKKIKYLRHYDRKPPYNPLVP